MYNFKLNLTVLVMLVMANVAWADNNASSFTDRAQVLSTTPIYQQVNEPRRECWTETVGGYSGGNSEHGYGGAILGGLVGGLLGNTVGQGNGRVAAAAVGAVTGAMVGDKVSNNGGYNQPRQVEHCNNHDNYRQVISGYNVVYRYQGRTMTAMLPQDPGKYVDVNVNVALAGYQRDERQRYDNYREDN